MTSAEGSGFPDIEDLVPHRGCNLLLERVLHADATSITVGGKVPSSGWFLGRDNTMPSWIGIELMAQAIAAHIGLENRQRDGSVRSGMLIGCKFFEILAPGLGKSEKFSVCAESIYRDDSGFAAYECIVSGSTGDIAKATLKAYQPENFKEFMERSSQ